MSLADKTMVEPKAEIPKKWVIRCTHEGKWFFLNEKHEWAEFGTDTLRYTSITQARDTLAECFWMRNKWEIVPDFSREEDVIDAFLGLFEMGMKMEGSNDVRIEDLKHYLRVVGWGDDYIARMMNQAIYRSPWGKIK